MDLPSRGHKGQLRAPGLRAALSELDGASQRSPCSHRHGAPPCTSPTPHTNPAGRVSSFSFLSLHWLSGVRSPVQGQVPEPGGGVESKQRTPVRIPSQRPGWITCLVRAPNPPPLGSAHPGCPLTTTKPQFAHRQSGGNALCPAHHLSGLFGGPRATGPGKRPGHGLVPRTEPAAFRAMPFPGDSRAPALHAPFPGPRRHRAHGAEAAFPLQILLGATEALKPPDEGREVRDRFLQKLPCSG